MLCGWVYIRRPVQEVLTMTSIGEGTDSNIRLIHRFTDECWNGGNLAKVPEMVAERLPVS